MLYKREQYHADARVESTLDYRCAHCDYCGHGDVEGSGSGSAGGIGLPGGGIHAGLEMAQDAANAAAWQIAFAAIELARCPRCEKRQPGAAARYARGQVGRSLLVGAGMGVIVFLLVLGGGAREGVHVPLLVGLSVALLVATTLCVYRLRRALHASYLVQWRDP